MFFADFQNLIQLRHAPAHVHEHDCFCFRSDGRANSFRTQAQRLINFCKHRQCASKQNGLYRSDVGKRRYDHLIACANTSRIKCTGYCCRTTRNSMGKLCARQLFYFCFKLARLPDVVALRIVVIAKKDACFQYIIHFFALFNSK